MLDYQLIVREDCKGASDLLLKMPANKSGKRRAHPRASEFEDSSKNDEKKSWGERRLNEIAGKTCRRPSLV